MIDEKRLAEVETEAATHVDHHEDCAGLAADISDLVAEVRRLRGVLNSEALQRFITANAGVDDVERLLAAGVPVEVNLYVGDWQQAKIKPSEG